MSKKRISLAVILFYTLGLVIDSGMAASLCEEDLKLNTDIRVASELSGYLMSPLWIKCLIPTRNLIDALNKGTNVLVERRTRVDEVLADLPSKTERLTGMKLLLDYDKACLARSSDVPDALRTVYQSALSHLVIFTFKDGQGFTPFCHGLLVDGRVLTARHCFWGERAVADMPDGKQLGMTLIEPKEISRSFVFNDDSTVELFMSLDATAGPAVYIDHPDFAMTDDNHFGDDWLWLKVDNPEMIPGEGRKPVRSIPIDQARKKRLFVAGVNFSGLWTVLASKSQAGPPSLNDLRKSIRVDYSAACRLAFFENGVIHHMCQTDEGLSGTPIFVQELDNTLAVVGVQSSGLQTSNTCPRDLLEAVPNSATAPFTEHAATPLPVP